MGSGCTHKSQRISLRERIHQQNTPLLFEEMDVAELNRLDLLEEINRILTALLQPGANGVAVLRVTVSGEASPGRPA
jgi:hypothetical protein